MIGCPYTGRLFGRFLRPVYVKLGSVMLGTTRPSLINDVCRRLGTNKLLFVLYLAGGGAEWPLQPAYKGVPLYTSKSVKGILLQDLLRSA